MHFYLNQRVRLGKPAQNPREEPHHIIVRRADTHRADHVGLTQRIEDLAVQLEDASRIAEQHLAFSRQSHLPPVALEQLTLQHIFFQSFHLHADG
ncbi:hypothetical protein D9M71_814870 [compost metagenome]